MRSRGQPSSTTSHRSTVRGAAAPTPRAKVEELSMRVSLAGVALISALALSACEDGPRQIYAPSPKGAGDQWNDGQTPPSVDIADAGFVIPGSGTNRQEICNGQQK